MSGRSGLARRGRRSPRSNGEGGGRAAPPRRPGAAGGPVTVRVEGPGVSTPVPVRLDVEPGAEQVAEVGVDIAVPAAAGSPRQVTAIAEGQRGRAEQAAGIRVAETGWTMWMGSHFHYDPVWWGKE